MKNIAKLLVATYFLPPDAQLVKANKPVKGNVDCWFEDATHQYHRCLTVSHYNFIMHSLPISKIKL